MGVVTHTWQPGQFIRVNRAKFRQYLLTGIPVKWGWRFTHYEVEGASVKAFFGNGETALGDILVGADGLRSRGKQRSIWLRPIINSRAVRETMYQPNPPALNAVPAGVIVGEITLNREQYERHAKFGRSFYICVGHGVHFFVGLRSYSDDLEEGHYYWLYYFREDNPESSWVKTATKEELLSFARDKLKDLHPNFRELLDLQTSEGVSQAFIMYDRVPEVCPPGPVTLLGDATHPMTPRTSLPSFVFPEEK